MLHKRLRRLREQSVVLATMIKQWMENRINVDDREKVGVNLDCLYGPHLLVN